MTCALIPGSFDPVTVGHEEFISRAAALFDKVIVCVCDNSAKNCMFTAEERYEFLKLVTEKYRNVQADICDGLLAEYAVRNKCDVIIKGVRNSSDFDYEYMLFSINRELAPDIETLFIPARAETAHISSTMVRELIKHGCDFTPFVPDEIKGMF